MLHDVDIPAILIRWNGGWDDDNDLHACCKGHLARTSGRMVVAILKTWPAHTDSRWCCLKMFVWGPRRR